MILQDPMVSLDPLFTVGSQLPNRRIHAGLSGARLQNRSIDLLSAVEHSVRRNCVCGNIRTR